MSDAFENSDGHLTGENGLFSFLFKNSKKDILTPELLNQFEQFKEKFNSTTLSAEALAEEMGDVDTSIIEYAKTQKNGQLTTEGFTKSLQGMTLGAKAAAIGIKALAIAGNIIVFAAMSKGIQLAIEAIDNYVHRVEKAKEALSTSVANLDTTTNDVKELEKQLDEINQKISDINSLGGAQVSKDGELEKLQAQHDQLEANLALMREQEYFDAKDVADKASDSYNTTVTSQYKSELVDRGNNSRERFLEVAPTEELELSISAYKEYSGQLSKINNEIVAKELEISQARTNNQSTKALEKELATITGTRTEIENRVDDARKRSMDMAKIINDVIEANKQIENLQYDLTPKQLEEFEDAKKNYSEYDKFYKQFVSGILTSDDKLQSKSNNPKKVFNLADEDTAKEIDNIQKQFATLSSAIDKVKNSSLSGSDLLDLQQEFPALIDTTDDLDVALNQLVDETLNQVVGYLETAGASDGLIETFRNLANEAKGLSSINWTGIFDLSSFSDTIDRLSKITSLYDEFKDKIKDKTAITFDISDVDDLRSSLLKTDKQLGISEEQFNVFESILSSSESTVDDIQKAFDTLSSQFIYQSGCLDGLNTANRDLIVSQLELQGVTNAASIVTEELAQASEILAASGYSLIDATNAAYWALLDESGASEATKASLYQLNAAEIAYNNTDLSVQGKIDKLGQLASAYGDTASAAIAAAAADRVANGHGTYESVMEDLIAQMNRATSNITIQAPKISGSPSKKSGTGGSKGSKDTSEEINYIDRLLSQSEKRIQQYKNELEDAFTLKDKYTALDKIVTETESRLKTMDDVYKFYSDKASEKLAQIPEGLRDSVRDGTIDIETLNDEKLANLIKEFWDLDSKADDAKDKIRDLDKSIKDLAKQRVQIKIDVLENKQDRLNFKLDKYKALISAVVSGIEGEIDDVNDYYDRKVDKIQSQIDALETQKKVYQDQLDALNKQNEALEIQKKLEDALYEKRKAENNKNVHMYREDKGDGKSGFVWESDQDAVKDANEQYDEAVFDKTKYDLQTQIDAFDKQISALDETIDKLEKARDNELDYLNSIKDSWSSIEETAERIASMEMANGFWGDGWFSDIMNGDTSYLDDMTEKFQTTYGIISDNQQQIDRLNELLSTIDGVDNATAIHLANMTTGFNTLGTTATTQLGNVNTATTSIPPLTEENRALNEESLLLWGENFTTFGGQACGVADSIAVSYESMAARLEAAAERAVAAIKRIKRAERDDDDDDGYAKGTRNAKPGLHPVAEGNKPEIIIKNSGNAVVADSETYYPFSGGETVLKPEDTKNILSGDNASPIRLFNGIDMDYLNSLDPDEITAKYLPNFNMPRFDTSKMIVNNTENRGPSLTIGKVEMHEVNNADEFMDELYSKFPQSIGQKYYKR